MKSFLTFLTALLLLASPALAQWQVPANTVPIGRGAGVIGFNSATTSGSGSVCLTTSCAMVTPILGTPTSGVATNLTGLPLTTGVTGVLPIANGGTAGKFSASVQSTGRFGIDNAGGLFSFQNASSVGVGTALRAQSSFSYTGGAPGNTGSTNWTYTAASAGVADYVWGLLSILDNSATGGQNVAIYGQGNKLTGAGPTWGGVLQAQDESTNADPTSGLVGEELDIDANGTDVNGGRVGLDLVGGKYLGVGVTPTITHGIRIGPQNGTPTQATFTNAITETGNIGTGLNLSGATISSSALWLADSQKISFDTANTRSLKWNGTRLVYGTPTAANGFVVADNGSVGIGVAGGPAVVGVDIKDASTDVQVRAVSGTIDGRIDVSTGSGGVLFGSFSNNDLIFIANGVANQVMRAKPGGHILSGSSTVPTITACGTSPSAATGTDMGGQVTEGTTATGCTITFSSVFGTAPFCVVTLQTQQVAMSYTISTSAIVVTNTSASNDKINWICNGN